MIAGSSRRLPGLRLPRFGELVELLEERGGPPPETAGLDLRGALAALKRDSRLLRRRALRPATRGLRGEIEKVALLDRGLVAVSGWADRDVVSEQAAMLLDGEKYDAGFSLAFFPRSDVPVHGRGFVGVMSSDWRPRAKGSEPFLFFGDDDHHIRSRGSLRETPISEIEALLERVQFDGAAQRLFQLRQMLLSHRGWNPRGDGGAGLGVALGIDRAVVLPGFGAIVEGWALSGPRKLSGLSLRLGGAVLDLDPGSLQRTPRPDLAKPFPLLREGVSTAGFSGLFIGRLRSDDLLDPMARAHFNDDATLSIALNPGLLQVLDLGFDIDSLRAVRPSLALEPRFPDLAEARSVLVRRSSATAASPVIRAQGEKIVVHVLPHEQHDLMLVLASLSQHLGRIPKDAVLALIGHADQNRDAILRWIESMTAREHCRISLAISATTGSALYACGAILRAHKARTFAFVGPHVWLQAAAYAHLPEAWATVDKSEPGSGPVFLPVSSGGAGAAPDAELFVWTAQAYEDWVETALVPFDEAAAERFLPRGTLVDTAEPAGVRLRAPGKSTYKATMDQVIGNLRRNP